MTENLRQQCEVFAKYGRQTQSCHQLPAADTGGPTAAVCSNNKTWIYISLYQLMWNYDFFF